jgi:hypothetical protein
VLPEPSAQLEMKSPVVGAVLQQKRFGAEVHERDGE